MKVKNLFVASMEPGAGKLLITMGIMEILSRRLGRVGFFRPIIDAEDGDKDNDIRLMLRRYCPYMDYHETFGFTVDEVKELAAQGRFKEVLSNLIGKLKWLNDHYDFVLCEGLNSQGFLSAFDKDINIEIAKNLGCPFVSVINGIGLGAKEVEEAIVITHEAVERSGCIHFAIFVNRLAPNVLGVFRSGQGTKARDEMPPVFFIPEIEELDRPTLKDIQEGLGARQVLGRKEDMGRIVRQFKIASMTMEHFLDYVEDGDLIVAAGDRSDIVLATIVSLFSPNYQKVAGIILTGGFVPGPNVMRLLKGRTLPAPVLSVDTDTYTTVKNITGVPVEISPTDERKIALGLGTFEENVDPEALITRAEITTSRIMTPVMFEYSLFERARADVRHIVLPESEDERILRATEILIRRNVVRITLLGDQDEIVAHATSLGLDIGDVEIVDPETSQWTEEFVQELYELRRHKGLTLDGARDAMSNPSYYGTMMVYKGYVDGMVSGAIHTTADTIRPALQIIKTKEGYSIVSSVFFMCLSTRVLVYGDCAINPDPNAEELAEIAIASAETAKQFGIEPLVAMLSYSTGDSGRGQDVEKVRRATEIVRTRRPDILVEGPIQYDAAIDPEVAKKKMPESPVAGRATVFIFPDLNTGNNTYKAVQRSSGAIAIGPILQGLKRPVNDLSRGCTVPDIVNTVAITAIQAQEGVTPHD